MRLLEARDKAVARCSVGVPLVHAALVGGDGAAQIGTARNSGAADGAGVVAELLQDGAAQRTEVSALASPRELGVDPVPVAAQHWNLPQQLDLFPQPAPLDLCIAPLSVVPSVVPSTGCALGRHSVALEQRAPVGGHQPSVKPQPPVRKRAGCRWRSALGRRQP